MSKRLLCLSLYLIVTGCGTGDAGPDASVRLACEPETTGCRCADPDVQPDVIAHCSATTVVQHAGTGFCCKDSFDCQCTEVGCYQQPNGHCTCGPAAIASNFPNTASVTECTASASGGACCFDGNFCTCGTLACADPSQQVAACTPERFVTCLAGQTELDTCK